VILGLQPEQRNDPDASLGCQRAGDGDGGRRFVKRVERPQEQPDLLSSGDDGGFAGCQRVQVRVTCRAGRQARLLELQLAGQRRIDAAGGRRARPFDPRARRAKVQRDEGARRRLAGDV
jgi:hypothetical protein